MVLDHPSGLRFDIYERVHLQESDSGIRELDEIELIPYIQVVSQGEQAVLKGTLQLTGRYVSEEEDRGSRILEHHIPVEITLPMNRIDNLEDVGVDIENFDVELISSRTLNVTGVLLLRGIVVSSADTEQWNEGEELVFTHPSEVYDSTVSVFSKDQDDEEENMGASNLLLEQETEIEDKQDLKIAFGSKKSDMKQEDKPIGLTSLIHKSAKDQENRNHVSEAAGVGVSTATAERVRDREQSIGNATADSLEWQKLFLQQREDAPSFRKLRMCIVQKEETIDVIADRYRLNSREIILYNRLGEKEISAGQVIYIPG